jgi:hypothetical protein
MRPALRSGLRIASLAASWNSHIDTRHGRSRPKGTRCIGHVKHTISVWRFGQKRWDLSYE